VTRARIAVVGATGFTGGLVASELVARGAAVRLIGRAARRLAERAAALPRESDIETHDVADWSELPIAAALDGCDAVISCAGPFITAGGPVVRAAVRARVPYCDSTGEQSFMREVFDTLDAGARAARIPVVPAAGYDFVPGDLGCAIAAAGAGPLAALEVTYVAESGATSAGTRRTMIEILAAPAAERVDGELRALRVGARRKRVETPFGSVQALSLPGGEAITVPRHVDVGTVRTFMGARRPPPGMALLPVFRGLVRVPAVRRFVQRRYGASGPEGPDERRKDKRFLCRIDATRPDGETSTVVLEALDPYGFTARALAELALRMADGLIARTGVLAPAEAVEPREFLTALGVVVREA
jgi:short subunit dehydrogenase-like uncharacterized protein